MRLFKLRDMDLACTFVALHLKRIFLQATVQSDRPYKHVSTYAEQWRKKHVTADPAQLL
jgi:hypothetical protein